MVFSDRCLDSRIFHLYDPSPVQNFGDFLPRFMARAMMLQPRVQCDAYLLVGSLLSDDNVTRILRSRAGTMNGRLAVWGCGARSEDSLSPELAERCAFFAVRGPRTRDALNLPSNTPLGDPGFLAPLFHTPPRMGGGGTLCIPHFGDGRGDAELLEMSGADKCVRPVVEANDVALASLLNQIAAADFVLSNSMHGAIIACAYGRPFAFWDNGHLDVPFKWLDLSESISIPLAFQTDVASGRAHYDDVIKPSLKPIGNLDLLLASPFAARPSVLLRAAVLDGALGQQAAQPLIDAFEAHPAENEANRDRMREITDQHLRRGAGGLFSKLEAGRLGIMNKSQDLALWARRNTSPELRGRLKRTILRRGS